MVLTRSLLLSLVAWSALAATVNQTLNLGYATYQGSFNTATGVSSFLGMRYASPPIGAYLENFQRAFLTLATGKLRLQAPIPPATVAGVQPATEFGAQCNQAGMGANSTDPGFMTNLSLEKRQSVATSEDCLFIKSE